MRKAKKGGRDEQKAIGVCRNRRSYAIIKPESIGILTY